MTACCGVDGDERCGYAKDGLSEGATLAGDEIPLGARIVAIADSIDAMLGKRLCKKSLTKEACREEIRCNAGAMYDPRIALLVVDHWSEIVGPVEFPACDDETSAICGKLRCSVPELGACACKGVCSTPRAHGTRAGSPCAWAC